MNIGRNERSVVSQHGDVATPLLCGAAAEAVED